MPAHFQPIPAHSSLFQPILANSSLFRPIPTCSSLFHHFLTYSSLSGPIKLIPAHCSLLQLIPTYSDLFQHIQAYSSLFRLFQPIPAYSSLFQPNPACSSILQPITAYPSTLQPLPAYSCSFPAHSSLFQPRTREKERGELSCLATSNINSSGPYLKKQFVHNKLHPNPKYELEYMQVAMGRFSVTLCSRMIFFYILFLFLLESISMRRNGTQYVGNILGNLLDTLQLFYSC